MTARRLLLRTRIAATAAALVATLLALAVPAPAHAAEQYVQSTFPCAGAWGSGQSDAAGTTYIACGSNILRYRYDGTRLADVPTPTYTYDVAPSPDGAILYIANNESRVRRMVRQANGTYLHDATWKLDTFTTGGNPTPLEVRSRFIASDDWGDVYVSNGGWIAGAQNVILKYSPAGRLKTIFGDYGNGVGQFNVNMGLAVTRDGRSIYVVEQTNGRVQRFDYHGDGTYRFALTWGRTDPANPNGDCNGDYFHAPYDIGLDPWNYVYVVDTTCKRMRKYTNVGAVIGTVGNVTKLVHGLAIDWHGGFFLGQADARFRRAANNPEPGAVPAINPLPAPDNQAPVLTNVTLAAPVFTQEVDLVVDATDNISVTEARVANEDGAWGAWRPLARPLRHTLTAGFGGKAVSVQVRDAAGNESNILLRRTEYRSDDIEAPAIANVTVPAATTAQAITVDITASDNRGVTGLRLANEDGIWSQWVAYAPQVQWTLSAGYGVKGVYVQVRDGGGNESNTVYRTLQYRAADEPPPPAGDVADPVLSAATIPALTATRDIVVTIEASDDTAVTRVRFANEDGNWAAWRMFAAQAPWTLSAGYGNKAVYVQVGDAAGRESTVLLLRTNHQADAPPPGGGGGGGAPDAQAPVLAEATLPAVTTERQVAVGLTATDNVAVAQVRLANEDGNWTAWQPYGAQVQWMLSAGYGGKAVYVQVRDAAGNESDVLLRRTNYQAQAGPADAADPVLRSIVLPDPARTQQVTVTLDATDDVAVTQVRFANEDGNWAAWQPYSAQAQWMLSAGNTYKVVYAQVRDAAGRESNVLLARTLLQPA